MPLIAPQRKPDRQPLSVKVDTRLLTVLKAYTAFIASTLEYVLNEAVLVTFTADREFQAWLAAHRPAEWQALQALRDEHRTPAALRRRPPVATAALGPPASAPGDPVGTASPPRS